MPQIVTQSLRESDVFVTVILCTRNRAAGLIEALEALAAQRVPEGVEWEALIVDNGSTDATRHTVESFIASGHRRFLYSYEPQAGKTFALNRGLTEARGEVLAFTDDDAIADPQWLAAIIQALDTNCADGVGGPVLPIWDAPRPEWLTDRFLNVLAVLDLGPEVVRLDWKNPPLMLFGVNMAFRRSVFQRIGNFNTTLGSRAEDWELFQRLAAIHAAVVYDPAVVVRHHISGDRLTRAYYREWHRANGRAHALLDPTTDRVIVGIPLYAIRKGMETFGRFALAIATRDREATFSEYLRLNLYAMYSWGRIKLVLFRQGQRIVALRSHLTGGGAGVKPGRF